MHFLDGEPVPDARLAALALPNYGCLTTMAVSDGRVRGLGMHLDRLRRDSTVLFGEAAQVEAGEVRRLAREAVAASGQRHVAARVTLFAADFDLAQPDRRYELSVLVSLRPMPMPMPSPAPQPGPLRVRSVVFSRDLPEAKHVGLFGQLYQRRLARLAGYDDALFLDRLGRVTEGVTWNIGFGDGEGRLVWPASAAMLVGVTARLLRLVAERAGIGSIDRPTTVRTAAGLPAAFATSAVTGVRPVAAIDGHAFGDQAGTVARLAELYLAEPGEML